MDRERWLEIESLFHRACECDPTRRACLLEETGNGDPELRRTLERLLANEGRAAEGLWAAVYGGLDGVAFPVGGDTTSHCRIFAGLDSGGSVDRAEDLNGLEPCRRVGPYELIRLLGAGGMAQVWLARRADGAFRREVALKLPTLTCLRADLEQRFARERDILASLEHPHIARFYDAGVDPDGLSYFAMEYVHGAALTGYCDAHRLGIAPRLKLFLQVLEAVQYAHAKHVIHRDLKPSNILVNESGEVQLLDFGVAKLLEAEGVDGAAPTSVYGRALTPDYASPELLCGDPIDGRTDVYSLGVVLYELLTGRRPYQLRSAASLGLLEQAITHIELKRPSAQIVPEAVVARATTLQRLGSQLRGDLDAIVLKALAKGPAERYASPAAMAEDIQRFLDGKTVQALPARVYDRLRKIARRNRSLIGVGVSATAAILLTLGYAVYRETEHHAPDTASILAVGQRDHSITPAAAAFTPPPHSIVVLPFVNMSGDTEQDYFSDGMTEELITALSQVSSLKVIARTSSFAFKGRNLDTSEIARTLNVSAILEGSVRRTGSQVRVTVQLINGSDGFHIWSQDYDRHLRNILALQSDIAKAVAQRLQAKLFGDEPSKIDEGNTQNPQAYDAYLRGKQLFRRPGELDHGIAFLERAVRLDPKFARAWAILSLAYTWKVWAEGVSGSGWLAKARTAAATALRLAPRLPQASAMMAWVDAHELNWKAAEHDVAAAEASDATDPATLNARANLSFQLGQWDDAIATARAEIERDPLSSAPRYVLGGALSAAGRYREAERAYRQAAAVQPLERGAHWEIALQMLLDHRPREALAEAQLVTDKDDRDSLLVQAYYDLGRREDSDQILARLDSRLALTQPYTLAYLHAYRGETDLAFHWLDRALTAHDPTLFVIKGNLGTLSNINRDPRYPQFLKKMGLPVP